MDGQVLRACLEPLVGQVVVVILEHLEEPAFVVQQVPLDQLDQLVQLALWDPQVQSVHLEQQGQLVKQGLREALVYPEELVRVAFLDHQVQLDFLGLQDQLDLLDLLVGQALWAPQE